MSLKWTGALMALLLLAGCQSSPTAVAVAPMAPVSHMNVGGADEAPVNVGLEVLSGAIVDPTEPEGFATDTIAP